MSRNPLVSVQQHDNIATIALNRPPLNAFSLAFLDQILEALTTAARMDDVRAVILESGLSNVFCAGLDLDLLIDQEAPAIRAFLQRLYIDLYDVQHKMPVPVIAAVNGAARGGGMTLAISCDVIFASDKATFGYPEINLGVPPAIHFMHLPRIVGRYRAFDLLFSGRTFDAAEAEQLGLIRRSFDKSAVSAAWELAVSFASKPPAAMRQARAAFVRANDTDYRRGVAVAVEDFVNAAILPEAQEGLRAFREKRKPSWK
ncbi:MAG: enoyl-CoA hydratase/isomerase family protein [Pseudomonadota bacterium]